MSEVNLFGVRHHGPGSARSVRRALEALKPDCLLIEGPPDAQEVIALLGHKDMRPPVAILIYAADDPKRGVYYPFAEYSPEWQAIGYGLKKNVQVRMMDLPQAHRMAMDLERERKFVAELEGELKKRRDEATERPSDEGGGDGSEEREASIEKEAESHLEVPSVRADPLGALAEAAGYPDGEQWWEHMVETRHGDAQIFAAIQEAMTALRERPREPAPATGEEEQDDLLREAHMRRTIRAAVKEGFKRIAVVCGAWHVPALVPESMPPAAEDEARLKGLAKMKVVATWVPWTYGRLTYASGYGAGVASPGWYEHLWKHPEQALPRWMTRVARLLREEDIDCSSAHVIEGVRLAQTLAAMRRRRLPGLDELSDATRAVFCFDSDLPMRVIADKLIVGERLGEVPDETPMVPLQRDLEAEQRRLRLKPEAGERVLELDLRNATDLDRSRLLHRLNLLGISWGNFEGTGGKGTFREIWRISWEPELAVNLIEAGVWGNTVASAASAKARDAAAKAKDLPALTGLLQAVFLADLPESVGNVIHRLESAAAIASDLAALMEALPSLANVARYGNVRRADAGMIGHAIAGLVARITVGLPAAVASLDGDAAGEMDQRIVSVNGAIGLLQVAEHEEAWRDALRRLADLPNLHGLIAGRATRLLLDAGRFSADDAATRMSLALSRGADPAHAASWVEGFLKGSGLLLLHDEKLWGVLDEWVTQINGETFQTVLPLLRRTFSTFAPPERRQMGQRVSRGGGSRAASSRAGEDGERFDHERAAKVLPLIKQILAIGGAGGVA
jgi:hypothetical protein